MEQKSLDLLEDIKRLLILQLVKGGASSEEIGSALGVSGRSIRNIATASKRPRKGK
jgi:DNA-binding NarL/FixJ family response regulator